MNNESMSFYTFIKDKLDKNNLIFKLYLKHKIIGNIIIHVDKINIINDVIEFNFRTDMYKVNVEDIEINDFRLVYDEELKFIK